MLDHGHYWCDAPLSLRALRPTDPQLDRRHPRGEHLDRQRSARWQRDHPAATGPDTNPWRYASGYHDPATGFLEFGTRYYAPSLARWAQTGPQAGKPQQPLTMNPALPT